MPFGNVNVDYSPCKSVGQLKSAALYMLGKQKQQIQNGVIKTESRLYTALGCDRDNFANCVMVTRKLNGKSYSRLLHNEILAHKMSISFHPDDNGKLDYDTAFSIAKEFADKFFYSKGYEVLLAVHTDRNHIHAHFLISNCNIETGKSYRRGQKELYEMSEFFGEQCLRYGLTNSVRENFYNRSEKISRDKETFAETQMKKRGAETFKDELREAIQIEIDDPKNKTFDDVIKSLYEDYSIECRVAGNTVSYRHPQYTDKNGKLVSVRGSKLGEKYTRKGIEYELTQKHTITAEQPAARQTAGRNSNGYSDSTNRNKGRIRPYPASPLGGTSGSGRQISNRNNAADFGRDVPTLDDFYERYRKQAERNEQQPAKPAERTERVPRKRSRRAR